MAKKDSQKSGNRPGQDPSPKPEADRSGAEQALSAEQIERQLAALRGGQPEQEQQAREQVLPRSIGYVRKHGGLPATKQSLGQNWLDDAAAARAIAASTFAGPGDLVLEVGPGGGALTEPLLERGAEVIGVEIDKRLVDELEQRFAGHPRLRVLHEDVLAVDWAELTGSRPFILAGNLPYNITSTLLFNALDHARLHPGMLRRIVTLLQYEVAERVSAAPGDSLYSVLSVFLRMWGDPELLMRVDRSVFRPPPKVDAGLLRVEIAEQIRYPVPHWETLRRVVKGSFSQRRKMLRNSLQSISHLAPLEDIDFDFKRRPQTLSAEEFAELARALTPKRLQRGEEQGDE